MSPPIVPAHPGKAIPCPAARLPPLVERPRRGAGSGQHPRQHRDPGGRAAAQPGGHAAGVQHDAGDRGTATATASVVCYRLVVDDGVVTGRKTSLHPLGPLTTEVMQTLWAAREPLTPRAVLDALNSGRRKPLAYTTVVTVLSRLAERDVVRRTPAGRTFAYEPAVDDAAALAVREVIRQHGEAAIAPFLHETRADAHLRARFERLLAED